MDILSKDQEQKPRQQAKPKQSSSSSSWEQPISDTQAVEISDYIMTHEEEQAFFSDEDDSANSSQPNRQDTLQQREENAPEGEEAPPSWEQAWHDDVQQPSAIAEDTFHWVAWLDEIKQLPIQGYKPFDDLLKSPHYMNQT